MNRLRHMVRLALLRRRLGRFDPANAIVACGSPRSGTTWLTQMLAELPETTVLFEPLHLERVPEVADSGFNWRTFQSHDAAWPEGHRLLCQILSGRLLNRWILSQTDFRTAFRARQLIVKFVRANRLLPWLASAVGLTRCVLLIRHPCAVVRSQLSQGSWDKPRRPVTTGFLEHHSQFTEFIESLHEPEELLAAEWAIDNFVPLTATGPAWQTVSYERLVVEPVETMRELVQTWGIDAPDGFPGSVRQASSMTRQGQNPAAAAEDLHRWKTQMGAESIERVFRVVRQFGFEPEQDGDRYFRNPLGVTSETNQPESEGTVATDSATA